MFIWFGEGSKFFINESFGIAEFMLFSAERQQRYLTKKSRAMMY